MEPPNGTYISNDFIDKHMGSLSGNAVKLYIAILRRHDDIYRKSKVFEFSEIIDDVCHDDEYDGDEMATAMGELIVDGLLDVVLSEGE